MVEIREDPLAEADELKRIIKLSESIDFPTAIFDSSHKCVYSKNGLITIDSKVSQYLPHDDQLENNNFLSTIFMIKDVPYCAKIIKSGGFYICGLFNSHELGRMARNTDFFDRIIPTIDVIQYNLVHLWDIMISLNDTVDNKTSAIIEEYMVKTNQVFQNFIEYIRMITKNPNLIRVDCYQMINRMVNRCNTFLAKCGRHIEFVEKFDECFISADQRHAFCAFINAIQNSLLYSPKNSVPIVTVQNCVIEGKMYVVIRIVNENSYYAEQQKELFENDFSKHKIGCGIPMINRLMEETGGEFTRYEADGKVTVIMKMPALKVFNRNALFFECDEYTYFETGIPDYLEFKMREVVDLFKES